MEATHGGGGDDAFGRSTDSKDGIDASVVKGRFLVLTAPESEQSFSMRYELTNNRGGKSVATYW